MIKKGVFALGLAMASLPVHAVHVLGHTGMASQPSRQQIDDFCRDYSQADEKTRKQYEQQFNQYCRGKPEPRPEPEPTLKPEQEQPRIDRIRVPGCLKPGSEVRVLGQLLDKHRLRCRLEAAGRRQSLRPGNRGDEQFRYRLDRLPEGKDFVIDCKVKGDRERVRIKACPSPDSAPRSVEGDDTSTIDLVPELESQGVKPGQNQSIPVAVRNRGKSRAGNQPYWVDLVLTSRDLGRGLTATHGFSGSRIIARGRQRLNRVPGSGQAERTRVSINIPDRLPEELFWCAFVDGDRQQNIAELNERNNLVCKPAANDDTSELTGLFGKKVRETGIGPTVDKPQPDLPLADERVPASLPMTLRVNGDPGLFTVDVPLGGPLRVSWQDLPDSIDGEPVERIYLRTSRAPFTDGDCSDGPDWPDGISLEENRNYSDVPAGGTRIDTSQSPFFSGAVLYFKGCIGVDDGGVSYVEETNTARVSYGEPIVGVGEFDSVHTLIEPGLDLQVSDILHAVSGRYRDRIAIMVRTLSAPATVDRDKRVGLRLSLLGATADDPRERRLAGSEPGTVWTETRTLGEFIDHPVQVFWTDYSLPRDRRAIVSATVGVRGDVNRANDEKVEDVGNRGATEYELPEEVVRPELLMDNRILQVVEERGGDDWALYRIDYNASSHVGGGSRLEYGLATVDGDGAPPNCETSWRWGGDWVAVEPGLNQSLYVLCRARATSGSQHWLERQGAPDGRIALHLNVAMTPVHIESYPYRHDTGSTPRMWTLPTDASATATEDRDARFHRSSGLADLVVESLSIDYSSSGYVPRAANFRVRNQGSGIAPGSTALLSVRLLGGSRSAGTTSSIPVHIRRLEPGETGEYSIDISGAGVGSAWAKSFSWFRPGEPVCDYDGDSRGDTPDGSGRVELRLDNEGAVMEGSQSNNESSVDVRSRWIPLDLNFQPC